MNSDFDPEFVELIDAVGERRAQALIAAAVAVAADIRADADELGTDPVDRQRLRVLSLLPSITFEQSRFWRYQLAECADRLAQDTLRWGAPVPRCTGEEMVLHLIVGRAAAADTGLPATQAMVWSGNPDDPDTWGDLSVDLFQDHDVLTLYDVPAEAVTELVGGVNLAPAEWFTEFSTPYPLPDRP
ncbi:hypothetical protein [Williamsia sp. 1135]|uniref:hypothetical protein n=1 Tax=Williamsia sp. 1135 TaxID=1889262 RepID=UPI000A0FF8E9|nr:hypothetical protein [Williamsia sp. 1135]ORM37534.1 hypothetical protein BFL43_03825 [Williamsia sp. 1135]